MTKTKEKENLTFKLSDETEVVLRKGIGVDIIKARKVAPDEDRVMAFLISGLATFNGKKLPAEEILELPMGDYLLLEEQLREMLDAKNFQQQEK